MYLLKVRWKDLCYQFDDKYFNNQRFMIFSNHTHTQTYKFSNKCRPKRSCVLPFTVAANLFLILIHLFRLLLSSADLKIAIVLRRWFSLVSFQVQYWKIIKHIISKVVLPLQQFLLLLLLLRWRHSLFTKSQ